MANYAIQNVVHGGLPALSTQAPVNGDTVQPTAGAAILVISGASGAPVLSLPMITYDNQVVGPRTVTMAASAQYLIPIPPDVYGSGLLTLGWSGTLTTVTVAAVFIPTS